MPISTAPVCVTGATGYVASEIVSQLLGAGYSVVGTTRDPERAQREGHITSLPGAGERLRLVAADLMTPGAFDEAVAGSEYVVHTASPYMTDVEDPQRDLVDPAVEGTLSVLNACERAGTVKRVVLTSSFAAITDEPDGSLLDETVWNTKSTLKRNPYYFSKAQAERGSVAVHGGERSRLRPRGDQPATDHWAFAHSTAQHQRPGDRRTDQWALAGTRRHPMGDRRCP